MTIAEDFIEWDGPSLCDYPPCHNDATREWEGVFVLNGETISSGTIHSCEAHMSLIRACTDPEKTGFPPAHLEHSGAPLVMDSRCGCRIVQCDVCMEVIEERLCSGHPRSAHD